MCMRINSQLVYTYRYIHTYIHMHTQDAEKRVTAYETKVSALRKEIHVRNQETQALNELMGKLRKEMEEVTYM